MAEVTAKKRGTKWEYGFECAKIGGERKRITKSGFKTKREALDAGNKAYTEYANTGHVVICSSMSLSDFLDKWMEERCRMKIKSTTFEVYYNYINYSIKPLLGKYRVSDLTSRTIQTFIKNRYDHGWKKGTIQKCVNIMSTAFKWGIKNGDLKINPAGTPEYPSGENDDTDKVLTPEQVNNLLNEYSCYRPLYTVIMIGYHCGLRISETLGLTWDDIDLNKKTLSVNKQLQYTKALGKSFGIPKFNSKRVIEFDDELLEYFRELKKNQGNEQLFPDYKNYYLGENGSITETDNGTKPLRFVVVKEDGTKSDRRALTTIISRCRRHGMTPFKTHSLRHTHCTMLIENGFDLKYVQHRMGHKNIEVTLDIYTHLTNRKSHTESEKLNACFR